MEGERAPGGSLCYRTNATDVYTVDLSELREVGGRVWGMMIDSSHWSDVQKSVVEWGILTSQVSSFRLEALTTAGSCNR